MIIETIAVIFGFACVTLCIRENIWCWPTGLVQVGLYTYIFFDVQLYSDCLLQIVLIIINLYGWYYWLNNNNKRELKVTRLKKHVTLGLYAIALIFTLAWGSMMYYFTNALLPYPDAFIMAMNLLGQAYMAWKKVESWYFWISANVVSIVVFAKSGLYETTGLYIVFLLLAIIGYRRWQNSYLKGLEQ